MRNYQNNPVEWARDEWKANSNFWIKAQKEGAGLGKILADFVIQNGAEVAK